MRAKMNKTWKKKSVICIIFLAFCAGLFGGATVILCEEFSAGNLLKTCYELYELYLYVIPACAVCIFSLTGWKEERSSCKITVAVTLFLLTTAAAYQIYRLPIFMEQVAVTIDLESTVEEQADTEAGSIQVIGFSVFDRKYKSGQRLEEGTSELSIPVGRNRKLQLTGATALERVEVSVSGNPAEEVRLSFEDGTADISIQPNSGWSSILKESVIKIFLTVLLSAFLCWIGKKSLVFCTKPLEIMKRWNYELAVFGLFVVHFLINSPEVINGWCAAWYAMDYGMGTGSRILPGALLSVFTGEYVDGRTAYLFIACTLVILMAEVAYLIGKCMRSSEPGTRIGIGFLIICYLSSPAGISYLWTAENMGRLELFVLVFALLAVLAYGKFKNGFAKYGAVALLSVFCMAAHQGYFFTYFMLVYTIVVYDMFQKNRIQKKGLVGGGVVMAVTAVSFLLFQFASSVRFGSTEKLAEALGNKTNVFIAEQALELEYFAGVKEAYYNLVLGFIKGWNLREKEFLVICLLFPLIVLFAAMWQKVFRLRKEQGDGLFTTPYLYMLLGCLIILPDYILNSDWSRWNSTVVAVLFFQLLYLGYRKDCYGCAALTALGDFVKRHKVLCVAVVLYLGALSKFQGVYSMPEADRLYQILTEGHLSYF